MIIAIAITSYFILACIRAVLIGYFERDEPAWRKTDSTALVVGALSWPLAAAELFFGLLAIIGECIGDKLNPR